MNSNEKILLSAKNLFIEKGFNGTSMREITKNSGVSQGGIYSCFANKEEIFKEVLINSLPFEQFMNNLNSIASKSNTPEDFFKKLALTFLNNFNVETMKLRMIDFMEFKGKMFHQILNERMQEQSIVIIDKIQEFIDNNKMRDINPHTLMVGFFMSVFSYIGIKAYMMDQTPSEKELLESMDIFLYGTINNKTEKELNKWI